MNADPNDLEVLAAVPSEVEAAAIVGVLHACGIQATAAGGYIAGFKAEAPGTVAVLVKRADVERAHQVVDQVRREQHDVDWSEVDVGDPE